jgi:hypothetical protein
MNCDHDAIMHRFTFPSVPRRYRSDMSVTDRWQRTIGGQPQFLRIRWEATNEDTGEAVILEATLCLAHRREIALNDSARAAGQFGDFCDLCRGRQPTRVGESHLSDE